MSFKGICEIVNTSITTPVLGASNLDLVFRTETQGQKMMLANGSNVVPGLTLSNNLVGIGKSNPAYTLDVNGDTNISGNLYAGNIIGLVLPFAGSTAPTGWLLCYGQAVSRTTYSKLFAVISTTYGVGDGSTTFALPDLRGRVIAGVDNMGGAAANRITSGNSGITGTSLGASGGVEAVTLSAAQSGLPAHNHTINDAGHAHTTTASSFGGNSGGTGLYNPTNANSWTSSGVNTNTATTGITINNVTAQNASASHNNVQPSIIMNYIIKF